MARFVDDDLIPEPPPGYYDTDDEPPPEMVELAPWEEPPPPPELKVVTNGHHDPSEYEGPLARYLRIWSTLELADHVAALPPVNWLARRIWPGDAYGMVAAEKKAGKAQPLHSRVLTSMGWRTMGEMQVGMAVIGSDGKGHQVTGVFDRGEREVYRVTFSDGATVDACDEHLWTVQDANGRFRGRPMRTMTTAQLRATLRTPSGGYRWRVPLVDEVQTDLSPTLPLDPYLLGVLLGDGGLTKQATVTTVDQEIIDAVRAALPDGVRAVPCASGPSWALTTPPGQPNTLLDALDLLGLRRLMSQDKHVPPRYLSAPASDRLALLQGLMDTDGGVERHRAIFCSTSKGLAQAVRELAESLGGTGQVRKRRPHYRHLGERRQGLPAYLVTVRLPAHLEPFRLTRKREAYGGRKRTGPVRSIRSIEPIGRMPVRCIAVDVDDHLYVTDHHVLTHNSWAALDMAVSVASGTPWLGHYEIDRHGPVLAFLGEGGERKMQRRLDAVCESRGLKSQDLPIRLCFRVPHLSSVAHLAEFEEEVTANTPVLVILDPLYLAARGAQSSQLNEMGAALENVQVLCQRVGAALSIVHHWNQGGKGKGSDRMSGAGPAEWGRVLVSVAVKSKRTDEETGASDVVLDWFFEGDEIPDTKLRIHRRVWVDDQEDLASPMHYRVSVLDHHDSDVGEEQEPTACKEAILDVLAADQGSEYSQSKLVRALKDRGRGFRPATVKEAAEMLGVEGRIRVRAGARRGRYYQWDAQAALDSGDTEDPEPF